LLQEVASLTPLHESLKKALPEKPEDEHEKHLAEVCERFDNAEEAVQKQNDQLTKVLPEEEKYYYTNLKVSPWLNDAEKDLENIKEETRQPQPSEELPSKIKEFKDDIAKKEPMREEFNTNADDLLEKCNDADVKRDVPYVKDEVKQTNERWDKLVADVDEVEKDTDELAKLVANLEKAREPVEECVEAVEQTLEEEPPMDFDDVDALKAYQDHLDDCIDKMQVDEPKLKNADKKCDDLVDFLNTRDVDPSEHQDKENELNKKWDETTDKLNKKKADVTENLKHLDQFTDAIGDLDNWVNMTTATVTNMGNPAATPEGIQKQLAQVDAVQEQITKQKANLNDTKETGDWLCDENKDQPQFCANVNNKINKVDQPLEALRALLADKKKRLHDALTANQDFNTSFKEFLGELDKMDNKKDKLHPLSVDYPTLRSLDDEQKVYEQDIEVLKPLYEKLVEAGNKILEESGKSNESDELEKQLQDVKDRFDDNVKTAEERRDKLEKIMPKSEKFFNNEDDMTDWLDKEEKLLEDFVVAPVTSEDLKQAEKKLDALEKDIAAKKPVYEETLESSKDLLTEAAKEGVTEDVPEATKKADDVTNRWEELQKSLQDKKDLTEKYKDLINKYNEAKEPVQETLNQFEGAVEKRPEFGVDPKKASEELERVKELLDKLDEHKPQIDDVKKVGEDLKALLEESEGDSAPVKEATTKLDDKAKKLRAKLAQNKDNLEETARVLNHFTGIGEEVEKVCDDATKELDKLGPVSKNPEEAKKQIQKVEVSYLFPVICLHNL